MEHLEGILRITDNELGAIVTNGKYRSREEIDSVYKLLDIAKDVYCVWQYEDEMNGESYADGMSYERDMRGGRSYRDGSYDGGSYARGRGRNAKRDSLGRYSREGSYRGYSREGKEEYIEHLREMAEDAPDEQTRQSIHRMIEQMK